ncbi:HNH endonuclease [Intestinibacter bartlettii]|jgi:5-methylcytosine-specific restriction endonuclease McrA|uniref:HNH endonuclease n=1 Tax=Intestinibacter bartlettii TaxID=261299 RepID=UPI0039F4AE2A
MTRDELVKWIKKLRESGELWRFYKSKEWRHLKDEVLKEQHFECQICKQQGIITKADTVHHNQFVTKHPSLALSKFYYYKGKKYRNLIGVCKACHNKLHPEKHGKKKLNQVTEERW